MSPRGTGGIETPMGKHLDRLDLSKQTITEIMGGVREVLSNCRYVEPLTVWTVLENDHKENAIRLVLLAMAFDGMLNFVYVPVHAGDCMAQLVEYEVAEEDRYDLPDRCEKCLEDIEGWIDVRVDLVFTE